MICNYLKIFIFLAFLNISCGIANKGTSPSEQQSPSVTNADALTRKVADPNALVTLRYQPARNQVTQPCAVGMRTTADGKIVSLSDDDDRLTSLTLHASSGVVILAKRCSGQQEVRLEDDQHQDVQSRVEKLKKGKASPPKNCELQPAQWSLLYADGRSETYRSEQGCRGSHVLLDEGGLIEYLVEIGS